MKILLSVIIPIYNVEPYLNRCIDSVINQTYENLEIIMVDDGSPDNCPQMCDEWAEKDARIRVIHKKNGGLSNARNKGIDIAKGDYLSFVDSDDFIDLNMYSIMIEALERTDSDIATCGRYSFRNGVKREEHSAKKEIVLSSIQAIDQLLRGGIIEEASWDKVYKKFLFDNIRFPFGEINEDLPIMPYLFRKANWVVCIPKSFYYYCENPSSITHSVYGEKQRIFIKHNKDVSSFVLENYPELNEAVREFQARSTRIITFAQNPELKKLYPEDWNFYKESIKNNLSIFLKSKYRRPKYKLEVILALLGVYEPIWKLKCILK